MGLDAATVDSAAAVAASATPAGSGASFKGDEVRSRDDADPEDTELSKYCSPAAAAAAAAAANTLVSGISFEKRVAVGCSAAGGGFESLGLSGFCCKESPLACAEALLELGLKASREVLDERSMTP